MSLQVTTGYGSLAAIGVGMHDIAMLYSLGRRAGNWLNATSGDADLLAMMEQDEMSIIRRRGVVDIDAFRRKWCVSLRLLRNGTVEKVEGPKVEELIDNRSHFTAAMICLVAALDEFTSSKVAKRVVVELLNKLLDDSDVKLDILNSQSTIRINAWRSAAAVREINLRCRTIRGRLLQQQWVMSGYMPTEDVHDMVDFLFWLLAGVSTSGEPDKYLTASSDVAGVAICLSNLCFGILSVKGIGEHGRESPCQLIYDPNTVYREGQASAFARNTLYRRQLSTTISLTQPEESLTVFPVSGEIATRCRGAWTAGAVAASKIELRVHQEGLRHRAPALEIVYEVLDHGTSTGRVDSYAIFDLANKMGLGLNKELCDSLTSVLCFESNETLSWILAQISPRSSLAYNEMPIGIYEQPDARIAAPTFTDEVRINAFTVFQAFIMGYYYNVFGQIVDTSTLHIQTVLGSWGYRSTELLCMMRNFVARRLITEHEKEQKGEKYYYPITDDGNQPVEIGRGTSKIVEARRMYQYGRNAILEVLSALYCNSELPFQLPRSNTKQCLGVVGKRALMISSLLRNANSLSEIGKFVVLDADVGGIPTNIDGLIRASVSHNFRMVHPTRPPRLYLEENGPPEDFTRHIEADWEGDPETTVLCIRYKGRRLGSLNPELADVYFSRSYVQPVSNCVRVSPSAFHECSLSDIVAGELVGNGREDPHTPVVVQAYARPCMRYALTYWYQKALDDIPEVSNTIGDTRVVLTSNCIHKAFSVKESDDRGQIVIAGDGNKIC